MILKIEIPEVPAGAEECGVCSKRDKWTCIEFNEILDTEDWVYLRCQACKNAEVTS